MELEIDDMALLNWLKDQLGTYQEVAKRVEVSPAAVSNWTSAGRIPEAARRRLQKLEGEIRNPQQPEEMRKAPPIPERLLGDAEVCGFWGKASWSFHYLTARSAEAADDEIWRLWNRVQVRRSVTFRHNTRFLPFGKNLSATTMDREPRGYGYMRNWQPGEWRSALHNHGKEVYLSASAQLEPDVEGRSGGYYVCAPESVMAGTDKKPGGAYEFVTFRPECPVETNHLVLSLPESLLGNGLLTAFRVALDWSQLYDIASDIAKNQGELTRIIEPWGEIMGYKELSSEHVERWAEDWKQEEDLVADIRTKFLDRNGRRSFIVTDPSPLALATLVLLWPLPNQHQG